MKALLFAIASRTPSSRSRTVLFEDAHRSTSNHRLRFTYDLSELLSGLAPMSRHLPAFRQFPMVSPHACHLQGSEVDGNTIRSPVLWQGSIGFLHLVGHSLNSFSSASLNFCYAFRNTLATLPPTRTWSAFPVERIFSMTGTLSSTFAPPST